MAGQGQPGAEAGSVFLAGSLAPQEDEQTDQDDQKHRTDGEERPGSQELPHDPILSYEAGRELMRGSNALISRRPEGSRPRPQPAAARQEIASCVLGTSARGSKT